MQGAVPNHLHFIWIGECLPWFAQLALRTAARACRDARVTLWTGPAVVDQRLGLWAELGSRFEVRALDGRNLFEDAPAELPVELLGRLFASLRAPAARANIARLMILARLGGVYLDTDTVTLRDLTPLRLRGAFCGLEHVVWPAGSRERSDAYRWVGGPLRSVVRTVCARAPGGDALFSRAANWYPRAANNAVLGFPPAHPLLLHMLKRVDALSAAERHVRFRLGTHLLQEVLETCPDAASVQRLSPVHFYPLGPEISRHYFRPQRHVERALRRVVTDETYVVHWYASVSALRRYDEASMRAERAATLFGRISASALGYA